MGELGHTMPKVPIIGGESKKVKCCAFEGRATILCDCGSPNPVDIPGFSRAGLCSSCKRKFVISALTFTNKNGHIEYSISIGEWAGPMSASREMDVESVHSAP